MANKRTYHPSLIRAVAHSLESTFNDGFYADKVMERILRVHRQWRARDRKFLAETVYDMVRWWSLLACFDRQPMQLREPPQFIRRWLYYELWRHDSDATGFIKEKLKDLAACVEPVEFMRAKMAKGNPQNHEQVSFPPWLFDKFTEDWKEDTTGLLKALNDAAPVYLRVNTLKATREEVREALLKEEIVALPHQDLLECLVLEERKNVFISAPFKAGFFEVQDAGSQRIAMMLNPKAGERIADVCAGAGGKTLHLAALMKNKGTLLAGDVSERKLEELKLRTRRAGVSNLRVQRFESSKDIKKHIENFDAVLIDAPCSGSGVLRRNPDSKWKLSEDEIIRLTGLQKKVLDDYSRLVKKGGRLLYATCSLLKDENQEQMKKFVERHPDFKLRGEPMIRRPDLHGEDGFFAQELVRN